MTRELIAAVMLFLPSSASMSGRNVTLESDVDKAAAIIFSDGSPRATLVVGTSKACEQIKSSHKQSAKDKITLLFSDNAFSHFFAGTCDGQCNLVQLSRLSIECKTNSQGRACMPYAAVLNDKIYAFSYDPLEEIIKKACFGR